MAISTFKATAHLQEGMAVQVKSRQFEITIDEPRELGGTDTGMNPVELTLCALGACQAIVARVYASQFGINLEAFSVELEGDLDIDGFLNKADVRAGFSEVRYNIHVKSDASYEKMEEFIAFVGSKCPVGDTISSNVKLVLNKIVLEG